MKVSAISQPSTEECKPRHFSFISYSNKFMSVPTDENPNMKSKKETPQTENLNIKKGIETLENFTIYPKEIVNGKTVITA